MYRQKVMIRTLGLAASVVLAATACGPQGSAPAAPGSSASAPAASPSGPDDKPGGGGSSPAPGTSASAGQPSAQGGAKPIMANGDESDRIRELQARLRQLKLVSVAPTGFYGSKTTAAVKTFQSNNGLPSTGAVDEATWQKIQSLSKPPTEEELRPPTSNELAAPDPRCMEGRVMCISKESRTLAWMIDGKVVSSMDVRFGSENTPTREGLFKVDRKERKWKSTLYHTDMPYSMFFSHGQAVHYSQDFASRGYSGASHGCVNVRDMARLSAMFEQVQVGDKVVVYW
ncbi:peptidoglycan-binding protein [Streptomyces sp. NPDC057939]|uniref:L,D-transpeptidase family protein n=1 Tax=Streptomyces sp. NPDC057939 TaxID=3346284 RepID=UPI0036E95C4B